MFESPAGREAEEDSDRALAVDWMGEPPTIFGGWGLVDQVQNQLEEFLDVQSTC